MVVAGVTAMSGGVAACRCGEAAVAGGFAALRWCRLCRNGFPAPSVSELRGRRRSRTASATDAPRAVANQADVRRHRRRLRRCPSSAGSETIPAIAAAAIAAARPTLAHLICLPATPPEVQAAASPLRSRRVHYPIVARRCEPPLRTRTDARPRGRRRGPREGRGRRRQAIEGAGTLDQADVWGMRKMAYEIKPAQRGRLPLLPLPGRARAARAARPQPEDHRRRPALPDLQGRSRLAGEPAARVRAARSVGRWPTATARTPRAARDDRDE